MMKGFRCLTVCFLFLALFSCFWLPPLFRFSINDQSKQSLLRRQQCDWFATCLSIELCHHDALPCLKAAAGAVALTVAYVCVVASNIGSATFLVDEVHYGFKQNGDDLLPMHAAASGRSNSPLVPITTGACFVQPAATAREL
eukprot:m.279331 g.279331  ORF g.279331 m.279331 type:complete len:142 (-) comp19388_c0_seq2:525-950(-)